MAYQYINIEFAFPQFIEKELIWLDKNINIYFALKLNNSDSWTFFAGNASHSLETGQKLINYGTSEANAQTNYLTTNKDTNGKILAVLPTVTQAKYARIYVETGNNVNIWEWIPSSLLSANEIITGELTITDKLSDAPLIKVTASSVDRIKIGKVGSDYGIKCYDNSGNILFESSNAQNTVGGWDITASYLNKSSNIKLDPTNKEISINNATFGNKGIQLDYNGGTPRAYIGDGSNAFVKFDGTKLTWKATNTELDTNGNLIANNVDLSGSILANSGNIGGWSITATSLTGGNISLSSEYNRIRTSSGNNYVDISASGLRGYDSVLGQTFKLPINGDAPEFSSGIIKETEYQMYTSGIIQTASHVATTGGLLINNTSITGYNSSGLKLYQAVYGGTNQGDFYVGDYDNANPGLFYDNSTGTFDIIANLKVLGTGTITLEGSSPYGGTLIFQGSGSYYQFIASNDVATEFVILPSVSNSCTFNVGNSSLVYNGISLYGYDSTMWGYNPSSHCYCYFWADSASGTYADANIGIQWGATPTTIANIKLYYDGSSLYFAPTTGDIPLGTSTYPWNSFVIKDNGYIGSASATTAIQIASTGIVTLTNNLTLGTKELTVGSINRTSGTLTLEIGGVAKQSITSTETTLAGNLVIPDSGYIGSASATTTIQLFSTGVVNITGNDGSYTGLALQKESIDSTHIQWTFSQRTNNLDLWLVAYNGTSYKNFIEFDWTNLITTFGGNLILPNSGYIGSASATTAIQIDSSGNVTISGNLTVTGTYPGNFGVEFLAYVSATVNNITGDGTYYTIIFDTEVYDTGSNYNNSTGIFTAPNTGKYNFSGTVYFSGANGTSQVLVELVTSNRSYYLYYSYSDTAYAVNWSIEGADMDASDTAQLEIYNSSGSKTVDIMGSSSPYRSWFSGRQVG